MTTLPTLLINNVRWQDQRANAQLRAIRQQVFIHEQSVPVALEWDEDDAAAIHVLVTAPEAGIKHNQAIACARIVDHHKIGRMAVLSAWRHQGVGQALLQHCIETCKRQKAEAIQLSAQTHAIAFYAKAGFVVTSQPYWDAGILHVDMVLTID